MINNDDDYDNDYSDCTDSVVTRLIVTRLKMAQLTGPNVSLRVFILLSLFCGCALVATQTRAQTCGTLDNQFGPWDYTAPDSHQKGFRDNPDWSKLSLVEMHHFYPEIENLTSRDHLGKPYYAKIMGDLDYTLLAFPNHHRALYSMIKLDLQLNQQLPQVPGFTWHRTADCYFERALRFAPKDPVVHLLHGIYLHRTDRLDDALAAYLRSEQLNPNTADLHYNLGLLYHELSDFERAKDHAQRAYQLGHRQTGLRDKLAQTGHWP